MKSKTIELNLSRTIDATPSEVYDAWIDPHGPVSPWSGVVKAVVNPPKVDGLFYSMYKFENQEFAHYGRFTVLEKPRRIQYTWVSAGTQGLESVVTLNLEPQGDKTVVQINHSNLPDDEGGRRHETAQGYLLSRISNHFNKK
jgi:uncharacterized protein YndB with AHSA1/START domain